MLHTEGKENQRDVRADRSHKHHHIHRTANTGEFTITSLYVTLQNVVLLTIKLGYTFLERVDFQRVDFY